MTGGELAVACLLDAAVGDPRWFPHPVRWMGLIVDWCDRRVHRLFLSPAKQRMAGVLLAVVLPVGAYAAGTMLVWFGSSVDPLWGSAATVLLAWTTLAARDLIDHVVSVQLALQSVSLMEARAAVAKIVGRDTEEMDESDIVRATVETIAESTADGIMAPLFYLVLGGAPLALAYKAISTLDSMIGHLDDRYRWFGWASARLDDAVNFIPARITALLLVLSAGIVSRSWPATRQAWRILLRDGSHHPSPNSGRPEAAMAGALGIQLGGINRYDGLPIERPCLGDPNQPLTRAHIGRALTLMLWTSLTGVLLGVGWLLW
ncbi:MAG TPA: adenosylcobinamide-phosphate synthase CbiB [Nitrospiraceae bacterium]|nr:adenosylcobinamide-phosphate synthase CbiB [Nitrospiraceae bacterium]